MTEHKPLISILTNTKNRAGLISRCIESIQKQTYQDYEHIIADGGSDNTEEIVKSYNDPRIKYLKVSEGGPIVQTRLAFSLSKGEYITFLDDDDEYLPEKLEKQLDLIMSLPDDYGFIYGSMTYYDYKSNEKLRIHSANIEGGREILHLAIANPVICGTPTLMFRREVFESIGGTWLSGIGNEMSDWALVCKALSMGWKVGALKESYLRIYVNHDEIRMSDPRFYQNDTERYIKFHLHFLSEYADVIREYPKAGTLHYQNLIRYYIYLGKHACAFDMWQRLIRVRFDLYTLAIYPYFLFYKLIQKQ